MNHGDGAASSYSLRTPIGIGMQTELKAVTGDTMRWLAALQETLECPVPPVSIAADVISPATLIVASDSECAPDSTVSVATYLVPGDP